MALAQRDQWLRNYRMPGNQIETEALRERGDYRGGFQQRESLSDAAARAGAKWKIGAGRKTIRKAVEPALGTKGIGIVVIARVTVHHPLRKDDGRVGSEHVSAKLAGFDGFARHDVGRRIEPQDFAH